MRGAHMSIIQVNQHGSHLNHITHIGLSNITFLHVWELFMLNINRRLIVLHVSVIARYLVHNY